MAKSRKGGKKVRGGSMLRKMALPALLTGLVLATRKNKGRRRKMRPRKTRRKGKKN